VGVRNAVGEVVLVIALNDDVDSVILVVGFLKVGAERFVWFNASLDALLAVVV
jgi:hypothetical protein